eukprot:Rhum_TRINITY_DN15079_c1_g1::Rhum_TRINITY_DN15079_c1_g1_i1::g.136867::m.136867
MEGDDGKKVTVAVRIRPRLSQRGEKYELNAVKKVDSNVCVCVNPARTRDHTAFRFDYVLDEDDTQEDVYRTVAADISASTLEGVDNVIVTYGQTGSGKTFTLLGSGLRDDLSLDEDSGIFLRVLDDLLQHKELCAETHHLVIVLSIAEIYNDQLRDLLNPRNVLQVKEQGEDVVLINPTLKIIDSRRDMVRAFQVAVENRSVAPTLMNDRSSRSHALLNIEVLQQRRTAANPTPPHPETCARARHATAALAAQRSNGATPFSQPRMSVRGTNSARHAAPAPAAAAAAAAA